MDTREGLGRLAEALLAIDRDYGAWTQAARKGQAGLAAEPGGAGFGSKALPEKEMELWEAAQLPFETVPLEEAAGRVLAEMVYVYPPGTPAIVQGERLSPGLLRKILAWRDMGLDLQGMEDPEGRRVKVLAGR